MPHKARLLQAIRDEDTKLLQHQVFHIIGPGAVILMFIVLAGEVAVRLVKAPELFGGGMADVIGYGVIGVLILLGITKGYAFDKWVEGWLHLNAAHERQVGKIKSVIERLEMAELANDGVTAGSGEHPPQDDVWRKAVRQPKPTEESVG